MSFPPELKVFIEEHQWTFAKTMQEWPHEYIVRDRVDERLFEELVRYIRAYGHEGHFYAKVLTYYEEGGHVYWTMGAPIEETTIVNRCRSEDSYERRLANGTLPQAGWIRDVQQMSPPRVTSERLTQSLRIFDRQERWEAA
jgi:hypothetical protein